MSEERSQLAIYLGLFVGLAVLLGVFYGLGHRQRRIPQHLELPPDVVQAMEQPDRLIGVTPGIAINVYLDGSESIEHFLHQPAGPKDASPLQTASGTNYLRTLLDRVAPVMGTESAWHGHPLQFWRFGGEHPVALAASEVAAMSNHPDRSQFPELTTKIEVPFADNSTAARAKQTADSAGGPAKTAPELKIVVTDLYESSLKMGDLGEQIARKYLATTNGGAVSIVAVRNPFYGRVQDLPGHEAGKPFASSMPFYVILAGPAQDVRFATKVLLDRAGLRDAFNDGKASLFFFAAQQARVLADSPDVDGTRGKYHNITDNYQDAHLSFLSVGRGNLNLKWAGLTEDTWLNDAGQPATSWSISPVALASLDLSANAYGLEKGEPNKAEPDPDAKLSAAPCDTKEGICVTVDGNHLVKGRNYCFRVNLLEKPSTNFQSRSDALKPWSMEMQEAQSFSNGNGKFPAIQGASDASPGRTPDLSLLLSSLQGEIFPDSPLPIANHYYFFVHAD